MGAIVEKLTIRSGKKIRKADVFFDSGSPWSFIRSDVARLLGHPFPLTGSIKFRALWNGTFSCREGFHLLVNIKGIWCPYFFYVATIRDLDDEILIGQDFMQVYKITLDLKREKIAVNTKDLRRAQTIYSFH